LTGARPLAPGAVLLDTGVLVAWYARDDPRHADVMRWLQSFRGELHPVEPVLTEAAFFLPVRLRTLLADLARQGAIHVHALDTAAHGRMAELLRKFADRNPDWADMALVWLAENTGCNRIATLDVNDFSVYRIQGRKRFEMALLG